MKFTFLKKKKFYIPAAIAVVLLGLYFYNSYKKSHAPPVYETVKAERGNLVQTVEATGKIESMNDLALRFETAGTLDVIKVKENDVVKQGDVLASLRMAELNAAVAQASANLRQKLSGATVEDKAYYQAAADSAKAALDQAKIDGRNSVSSAEAALETARNNMQLAAGGENSQLVNNAYDTAVTMLQTVAGVLDDSLTQADNILGVDNSLANDSFESSLSIMDFSKLNLAKSLYLEAKQKKTDARSAILALTLSSSHADVDAAIDLSIDALAKSNQLLSAVSDVLANSLPVGGLSQTSLDAKKTTIETMRSSVNANYANLVSEKQVIATAKNSYSTYTIAFNKATSDLADAQARADANVSAREAAYNQALASLQSKLVAPREVDVAFYRAVLSQAIANRDKAVIKAPIDGIITKVNKKRGEMVSMSDPVIQMLSPSYEVKVDIPETDVPKLTAGDAAVITLDAFGDDVKFGGKIFSIEPASTEIQDVVYYKVTVTLDPTDIEIKPGMTANVNISTARRDNVIIVPLRAVRTNETKYVRLLIDGAEVEQTVKLGLKGDDGKVEILEGLSGGEEVIISVKAAVN